MKVQNVKIYISISLAVKNCCYKFLFYELKKNKNKKQFPPESKHNVPFSL